MQDEQTKKDSVTTDGRLMPGRSLDLAVAGLGLLAFVLLMFLLGRWLFPAGVSLKDDGRVGTTGTQGLPRIVNAPSLPTTGADIFPTMPGPGVFTIAAGVRQTLQGLDPVPGGQLLPMLPGITGTSLIYSLTNDTGFNQFLADIQGSAATRLVAVPTVVTLAGQEALILVGAFLFF